MSTYYGPAELVGGRLDGLQITGWEHDQVKVPRMASLLASAKAIVGECSEPPPGPAFDLYAYRGCKRHDGNGWLRLYQLQKEE